jgi:VanZ family protein
VQLDFGAPSRPGSQLPSEPALVLPEGAARSDAGLALSGAPACSERPMRELNLAVRASQELTLAVVFRLLEPVAAAGPVVSLAGEDGTRNLQLDVARDRVAARVRAAYPARRRVADFLFNVAAYTPLGFLVAGGRPGRRGLWLAGAVGLALSLGVEGLQTFRTDRVPSFVDLGTNTVGAIAGAWLGPRIGARRPARRESEPDGPRTAQ